jgi:hypothetical protein
MFRRRKKITSSTDTNINANNRTNANSNQTSNILTTNSSDIKLFHLLVDDNAEVSLIRPLVLHASREWKDACGQTLLHWAAVLNRYDVAVLLLDNGWNPKAVDNNNETPNQVAISNGNIEIGWVIEHFKSGAPSIGIEPEFLNFISQIELDYIDEWPLPKTLVEAVAMIQVPGVENAVRQSRIYWENMLAPIEEYSNTKAKLDTYSRQQNVNNRNNTSREQKRNNSMSNGNGDADDEMEEDDADSFTMYNQNNEHGLEETYASAIYLFSSPCIRERINTGLKREGDTYIPFTRLLLNALNCIPPVSGVVYAAVALNPEWGVFQVGKTFNWGGFVIASMYGNSMEPFLNESQLNEKDVTLFQINALSARPIKPYSSLRKRYEQYPFEMDMIIPYGARFRVENIMKINLYVTIIALSEIDFVSTDDFDLTGMEVDVGSSTNHGSKTPVSPLPNVSAYNKNDLTSPLRSKQDMATEIKEKHQDLLKNKPTITDDGWSDQHHQDFQYLFADGSRTAKQRKDMVSSGDESSTGSEYWSGDGKDDWTVDFGGPLTYKPEVEKPPPKSILFLMNFMAKKYESNKRIAKKMRKQARALARRRKKARKAKENEDRRLKLEKEQKEKHELLMLIHEQHMLDKETDAKKRRK